MKVLLYDPHPGFGGAAIPLPNEVKKVVDQLTNCILEIDQAIDKIKQAAPKIGTVEVSKQSDYILMFWTLPNGVMHGWRVIRFKEV